MKRNIKWVCLCLTLLILISIFPASHVAASAITATADWYKASATTLTVDSAEDLWAFATALNQDTTFSGKTILLTTDITVNEGLDIIGGASPVDSWPLTSSGKSFAGIFDGQGHTISGLYLSTTGEGVGFFGNVATGTTATVRNLTIENSYIASNAHAVGGIFGQIQNETTSAPITDAAYVNKTKGIIDNVDLDIKVYSSGTYHGTTQDKQTTNMGVGGFVGGTRADATITNSVFRGTVSGVPRGVAAFIGATRPYQKDSVNYYRTEIVIENCINNGTLLATDTASYGFVGALVGYANSNTETFRVKNVISTGTVQGKQYVGYLYGGSWSSVGTTRAEGVNDYQNWYMEDVYCLKHSSSISVIGQKSSGTLVNGYAVDTDAETLREMIEAKTAQSVTLKNDLALNLYTDLVGNDAVVTIDGEAVTGKRVSGATYCFTVDHLLPQQMRDEMTVEIRQTIAGVESVQTKTVSIASYAHALINRESSTTAEKRLAADLLRYGAAAQNFVGYNTNHLATEGLGTTLASTVTPSNITSQMALNGTADSGYALTAAALRLENSLALRLKFVAKNTTNLTVEVSINGRTVEIPKSEFTSMGGNTYRVYFEGIGAHEMNATITARLLLNGEQVGQALTYSIADYAKNILTSTDTSAAMTKAQPLVKAIYAYGLSASAYNDEDRINLVKDGEAQYVIVRPAGASTALLNTLATFVEGVRAKTGVILPIVSDATAATAKELVVGSTTRSESSSALANLTAKNGKGYYVDVIGEKLVVASGSDQLIEYALGQILESLSTHGGTGWGVDATYGAELDLPTFSGGTQAVYYADAYNHTLNINAATSSRYTTFISTLLKDGFVEYATHQIGNNLFGTYYKVGDGVNTVVYTMWYPNSYNIRVTYGPMDYLPEIGEVDSATLATPTLIQNARLSSFMTASGMSYIIQLMDGSFILIDGGNPDGTVTTATKTDGTWTESSTTTKTQDAKALYELLYAKKPKSVEKPVIAAWFITHAHGDHVGLANQFLETYHNDVELQIAAYNFPDFYDTVTIKNEEAINMKKNADAFIGKVRAYYPDAAHWVFHTGQTLNLPGCEVEILFTPEDYYGNTDAAGYDFSWGNHTSTAFRFTLGKTTFLVLGDCEATLGAQMAKNYAEALESDILQLTHHGSNGANYKCYEYIDPKICLWPVDQYRFETGSAQLGDQNASQTDTSSYLYANWWIRNSNWTRDDGTQGTRQHYAVGTSSTEFAYVTSIMLPSDYFN